METAEKINFKDYRMNYEDLIDYSNGVCTTYARIGFNYPNHPDKELWGKKFKEWCDYCHNLRQAFFATEEQAEAEINRLTQEYRVIATLEQDLAKKAGIITPYNQTKPYTFPSPINLNR